MRVAIINQFSSAGGGSRFARALVMGLAQAEPASEFDFFADASAILRDGLIVLFAPHPNVRVIPMADGAVVDLAHATGGSPMKTAREWAIRQPSIVRAYRWLKFDVLGRPTSAPSMRLPAETIRVLDTYDVVYLAWPYFIRPVDVTVPVVATFHDFNFKHGFGNFSTEMLENVECDTHEWLSSNVQPVSSTQFIADELRTYYPNHVLEPKVVFLSMFAVHDPSPNEIAEVQSSLSIPTEYVLCPSNTAPHKNLIGLLRALGRLKREGAGVPLVLTGFGTDDLNRLAAGNRELLAMYQATFDLYDVMLEEGLELGVDVFALGFVTDLEMDALIRGARAVVAPSRYEAGSGPALDAWKLGTLVISSNIPPVLEQMEFLHTCAYLFDPEDSAEMAAVIQTALSDAGTAQTMIKESLAGMARYTWIDVAKAYLEVFRGAVRRAGGTVSDMKTEPVTGEVL